MKNINFNLKNKGFSIIEIMVVILIIGLMINVIIPGLTSNVNDARKTRAMSDITAISTAISIYFNAKGNYPTTEEGLDVLLLPLSPGKEPPLPTAKKDPWGNNYLYNFPSEHSVPGNFLHYDIYSAGPDGEPGTSDDIGNFQNESSENSDK